MNGEKFNILRPSLIISAKGCYYLGCLLTVNRIAELSKRHKAPFRARRPLQPVADGTAFRPIRDGAIPFTMLLHLFQSLQLLAASENSILNFTYLRREVRADWLMLRLKYWYSAKSV